MPSTRFRNVAPFSLFLYCNSLVYPDACLKVNMYPDFRINVHTFDSSNGPSLVRWHILCWKVWCWAGRWSSNWALSVFAWPELSHACEVHFFVKRCWPLLTTQAFWFTFDKSQLFFPRHKITGVIVKRHWHLATCTLSCTCRPDHSFYRICTQTLHLKYLN